jgi:ribosomal protein S18 acetylase RimI-like enzyme
MITVRLICEEDIPGFREVLDIVARERRYLALVEAPLLESVKGFVGGVIKAGHAQFVALDEGRVVGWCDVLPGEAAAGTAHIGRLGTGVLPDYRGQGIGRRLLEAAIARARERGLEKIELTVYSSNHRAIGLYRKAGFVEEGRRIRGRFLDGIYDDVLLMALELKPAKRD